VETKGEGRRKHNLRNTGAKAIEKGDKRIGIRWGKKEQEYDLAHEVLGKERGVPRETGGRIRGGKTKPFSQERDTTNLEWNEGEGVNRYLMKISVKKKVPSD